VYKMKTRRRTRVLVEDVGKGIHPNLVQYPSSLTSQHNHRFCCGRHV
jgi:hypothetical protein